MSTPIRLNKLLVEQAAAEAESSFRTTPRQIEYWAEIGRAVAGQLGADDVLALTQGFKTLTLEDADVTPPDTQQLWQDVDQVRDSGALSRAIRQERVVYQASEEHPGALEAIYPDGSRATGVFRNGQFRKTHDRDDAA